MKDFAFLVAAIFVAQFLRAFAMGVVSEIRRPRYHDGSDGFSIVRALEMAYMCW